MKQQGTLQCHYSLLCVGLWRVLLHNGGYCNGCVTERCLHDSTNMILFHAWSKLEEKRFKNLMFLSFYEKNIGFDGKLESNKSVSWCSRCKIHRYVAASLMHIVPVFATSEQKKQAPYWTMEKVTILDPLPRRPLFLLFGKPNLKKLYFLFKSDDKRRLCVSGFL